MYFCFTNTEAAVTILGETVNCNADFCAEISNSIAALNHLFGQPAQFTTRVFDIVSAKDRR